MPRIADPFASAVPTATPIAAAPAAATEPQTPIIDLSPRRYRRSEVAAFCRVRDDWGQFSNFARCELTVDGRTWRSSEALYQALRFPGLPELQRRIFQAPDPFAVKQIAKEHYASSRDDWMAGARLSAMAWTLGVKARQWAPFSRQLLASVGQPIVEVSRIDGFWGARPDAEILFGVNALGQLLEFSRAGRSFAAPAGSMLFGRPIVG